ncbi:outer membrane lipoprotein-sorting protein [uncultured Microscilla sp.]|uniref:outer membrane lipoprotein-sorting protein n=1 Tax=uncultured Microscilla sp. TaxID=432653 RepID=UPI00262DF2D1|nr:outer membrane lipoprotein-sorting protein [uncultured Microscilla sp.]
MNIKRLNKFRWILIGLLLATANFTQAQNATEIVKKADSHMQGKSSQGIMTMTIVRPKWRRTVEMKSWSKGRDFSLILIKKPVRDKGSGYLKRGKEMWNWLPKVGRVVKMPPSMMNQSWMGSDFTNDDLVRQSSIVIDYTHKIIGSETLEGRDCYKVLLTPKPNAPVVWGKVEMWISKKDYLQLQSKMYDEDGYLVNTMRGSKIKNLGGRVLPSYMEMIPADKPNQKTVLEYKKLVFDKPISDSFFSVQNMKRVN